MTTTKQRLEILGKRMVKIRDKYVTLHLIEIIEEKNINILDKNLQNITKPDNNIRSIKKKRRLMILTRTHITISEQSKGD
jgi:hypothetical protein